MATVILNKDGKEVNLNENKSIEMIKSEENTVTRQPEPKRKEDAIIIDKLVDGYLKRTSTKMKEEYLKTVIKVKPYIGYGVKIFLADTIIKTSCLKEGRVYIDSCKKYMLYIYALIDTYTNIEINQKEWMSQYDRLDSLGLIEPILALIPEKERSTFKTILDMKLDDLMTNRYGIYAYIDEQMDRVAKIAPEIGKAFGPLIEKLSKQIETLDENKIEKMINKAIKFVR